MITYMFGDYQFITLLVKKYMWIYCIRMMVETNPDCLAASDDGFNCYPIHALLSNPNIGNLHEILAYLLESESSSMLG